MSDKEFEKYLDSHKDKKGIFKTHRCWRCRDGDKLCVRGNPNRCEYPRALND